LYYIFFSRFIFDVLLEHLQSIFAIKRIFIVVNIKAKLLKDKINKKIANKRKKEKIKKSFRAKIIAKHICKNTRCTYYHKSNIYYANLEKH